MPTIINGRIRKHAAIPQARSVTLPRMSYDSYKRIMLIIDRSSTHATALTVETIHAACLSNNGRQIDAITKQSWERGAATVALCQKLYAEARGHYPMACWT